MTIQRTAQQVWDLLERGELEYYTLYRVPASESFPWGDEVGVILAAGLVFNVSWFEDDLHTVHSAFEPEAGAFPGATKWMVTNNAAVPQELTA